MSILAANPCRSKAPTFWALDSVEDFDWIKQPNIGDLAGLVVPGSSEFWTFVSPSTEELDDYNVIPGGCQGAWVRGGTSYNVIALGATGDGITDDTDAFLRAFSLASERGGEVYIPPQFSYLITSELLVASLYPVHIVSRMNGYSRNGLTPKAGGIIIGANIAGSIIKYASPTANRDQGGGGAVVGIAFRDETGTNSTPGNYTCTAALELYDFIKSVVRDCSFEFINGSAIKTDFMVMSSVVHCWIRYCGAVGKPAFWITQTNSTYTTQSLVVDDIKMEVCHQTHYMRVDQGSNLSEIKIRNCGFESDPVSIPDSGQTFISIANTFTTVMGCHFNRTTAIQVRLESTSQLVIVGGGCQFRGTADATPALLMAGIDGTICNSYFNSGKTGTEILVTNSRNHIENCMLTTTGGILFSGVSATFGTVSNVAIVGSTTTNAYAIDIRENTIASTCKVQGDLTGGAGGIRCSGTGSSVVSCTVIQMGGIGIRGESFNGPIVGNFCANNTGGDFSAANLPQVVDNNYFYAGPLLSNTVAYGPVAVGAMSSTTFPVTVTGAEVWDTLVTGAIDPLIAGIAVTGVVTGPNTVDVTLTNSTGALINASGNVTVYVRKQNTYLQKIVTFDPGSIAAGAIEQTAITGVTDARQGDIAQAGISTSVAGVEVTAQVTGVDEVTVTFENKTGAPIDVLEGLLSVKVKKVPAT